MPMRLDRSSTWLRWCGRGRRRSHGRCRLQERARGSSAGPSGAWTSSSTPGPDPGMDEQIVAEAEGVGEALEKVGMRLAESPREPRASTACRRLRAQRVGIDAIAAQALGAAELAASCRSAIGFAAENAQQHFLMIAEQEDRPAPRAGHRSAAARRPAPSSARDRSGRRRTPARSCARACSLELAPRSGEQVGRAGRGGRARPRST